MLTQGKALWITSVSHDAAARTLVVGFTQDPERSESRRVASFFGVEQVESQWQDRDDGCMETLIGAHETCSGGSFCYALVTDQREIEFAAGEGAAVYDV